MLTQISWKCQSYLISLRKTAHPEPKARGKPYQPEIFSSTSSINPKNRTPNLRFFQNNSKLRINLRKMNYFKVFRRISNTIFVEVPEFLQLTQKNSRPRAKSQRKTIPTMRFSLALPQLIRKIALLTFVFSE